MHVELDDGTPWALPGAAPAAPAVIGHSAREVLDWHRADQRLPDSDTTVLCWMADGEWFSGWYDDERGQWFDAASGGVLSVVAWWAEPAGPGV